MTSTITAAGYKVTEGESNMDLLLLKLLHFYYKNWVIEDYRIVVVFLENTLYIYIYIYI